jgi:hypothetical protein
MKAVLSLFTILSLAFDPRDQLTAANVDPIAKQYSLGDL